MPSSISVKSSVGTYEILTDTTISKVLMNLPEGKVAYLVDENIIKHHHHSLVKFINFEQVYPISATEDNKSLENLVAVYKSLIDGGFKRDHHLVAIGGGITQDITCFIASTIFRGVDWFFLPTTLLAQADSCIGSKSSINIGGSKNLLGTFYPPKAVLIATEFLETLTVSEIKSGVGEMLKAHAIDSVSSFDQISEEYAEMFKNREILHKWTLNSLLIKKPYVEVDEFDKGIRNIFNYGHSFGHAIEAATNFDIPHGVAVSMGMDFANFVSVNFSLIDVSHYLRMRPVLKSNYYDYSDTQIPFDAFFSALSKDKKNTTEDFVFILPVGDNAEIQKRSISRKSPIDAICRNYLSGEINK